MGVENIPGAELNTLSCWYSWSLLLFPYQSTAASSGIHVRQKIYKLSKQLAIDYDLNNRNYNNTLLYNAITVSGYYLWPS